MVNPGTVTVPIENIDETTYAQFTEEAKQQLSQEINAFNKKIELDISDPKGISHTIIFKSKRDVISMWANNLKKLHYLGVYEKPVNTISSYIKNKLGKLQINLDKKEISYRYVDEVLDSEYKISTKPRKGEVENPLLNTSDKREFTSEERFLLETIKSLHTFYKGMASITETMYKHLENPNINADMQKYFDEYHKIAALREPVEFMMGKGSILHQIDDEQNIRESATIFQLAIAKSMEATLSYRQMAHYFAVSPRQNQRIRNRLEDWPAKDVKTVIRKNILSYCCQNPECGMNVITGKKYNSNGDEVGKVKLYHKSYPIPDKFKGQPLSPIQIALEVAKFEK